MTSRIARYGIILLGTVCCAWGQGNTIMKTIAGGYLGDGGPATKAGIYEVRRTAIAPDGTMYLADKSNHRVRRVTPDGRISTYAGTGESGFSGDGGPATQARFYFPEAVALDKAGNLYVADQSNARVRKITKDGIISTYVGNGAEGGFRYGVPATSTSAGYPKSLTLADDGTIYVCDRDYNRVYKVSPQGILTLVIGNGNPTTTTSTGDGGQAVNGTVAKPSSLVIGSDNSLYISELAGNRIRRIDPNGVVTTFAGSGSQGFADGAAATARFNQPDGMLMIGTDLYVADSQNQRIRRIRNGAVNTIAGTGEFGFSGDGGLATQARLRDPKAVNVDPQGNLIVNDLGNGRIRRIDIRTGMITTIAGAGSSVPNGDGGPALGSFFLGVAGLFMESNGTLLVADAGRNRIRAIDRNGLVSTWAGGGEEGVLAGDFRPLAEARFAAPVDITSDRKGTYYIVDRDNNRVRKVDPQGTVSTFAGSTRGNSGDDGPATRAQFNMMRSAALHPQTGELFIADTDNHCIRKVDLGGIVRRVAGQCGVSGYSGDGNDARSALLRNPADLVFDSKGVLYIADTENKRVRKVENGIIRHYAGDGRQVSNEVLNKNFNLGYGGPATTAVVGNPNALAVDKDDNVYIAATHNITKVDARTGIISLMGGEGTYQFRGDDGPARLASLNNPVSLLVDADLNIYISDERNGRVRMITSAAATSTVTFRTSPPGLRVLADGQELADGQQVQWIPNTTHAISASRVTGTGNTRFAFANWSTGSREPVLQVRAGSGNAVFTATFTPQHKLALSVNGAGLVDANPPLADGGYYDEGAQVSLTPIATRDWTFAGFSGDVSSGDSVTVTMSAPRRIVANFAAPTAELSVSPAQLSFRFQQGGEAAPEQLVTVASTGFPLDFQTSITGSANFGLTAAQSTTPGIIRVSVVSSRFVAGSYRETLTISSPNAASVTIPVLIEVAPAPVKPTLQISPQVMDINVSASDQSVARFIDATSSGGELRLGWGVRTGAQWLIVRPEAGSSTPATFRVDVLPRGLPPGVHSGRVEFVSPDSSNGPQVVVVNLSIEPEAPKQLFPSAQRISFQYRQKRTLPGVGTPPQSLSVTSNQSGLRFYSRAAVSAQTPWLTVRSNDGSATPAAPSALSVSASGEGLEAGLYEGSVELRLEPNGDVISRVPVLLEVVPPAPLELVSDRPEVRFDLPSGSAIQDVVWRIQNNGDEPVDFNVASAGDTSWLRVSGERTSASPENPGLIRVGADTRGMAPGTYEGSVLATAGEVQLRLPVVLTVNPSPRKLVAAERTVKLMAKSGDSPGRFLDLLLDGQGSANWTAVATTEKGGNWLRLQPSSGTLSGNLPQRTTIIASSLPAGTYTGRIKISSDQTSNIEEVVVNLEVSASKDSPPDVDRAGIVLVAQPGSSETNRVSVEALYSKMAGRDMSISVQPPSWLRVSTTSLRLSSGPGLGTFQIWAQPSGLPVGQQQGTVMLTFTDGQRVSINVVLLVVSGTNSAPAIASKNLRPAADGCVATRYTSVFATNEQSLNVRVGEAARTEFVIVDNCGVLLTQGAVSNSFSNGDRPVDLRSMGDGIWRGSWSPRFGEDSGIAMQLDVIGPNGVLELQSTRLVTFLSGRSEAPILDRTTPFVTPGQRERALAVAPGGRVIIRGERLSDSRIQSTSPVPQLGNTRVTLGGVPMQILSVSPTEIEALVPPEGLSQQVAHPLIVTRGTELSAPETLSVADSWPTIVEAGINRAGGIDVVLTHVKPAARDKLDVQVDGVSCTMSALVAVRNEPGYYYSRGTGCPATEGARIQTRMPLSSTSAGAVVKPQARRKPVSPVALSER